MKYLFPFFLMHVMIGLLLSPMTSNAAYRTRNPKNRHGPVLRKKIFARRDSHFVYESQTLAAKRGNGGVKKIRKMASCPPIRIPASRGMEIPGELNYSLDAIPTCDRSVEKVISYFSEQKIGFIDFLLAPNPRHSMWQVVYPVHEIEATMFGFKRLSADQRLVVAKINASVGSGLFLSSDSKIILPDTYIGIYYGDMRLICEDDLEEEDPYLISHYIFELMRFYLDSADHRALVKAKQIKNTQFKTGNTYVLYVDAAQYGNPIRYINHGTKTNCAFQIAYKTDARGKIVPVVFVRTKKMICPGDQLLIDYGKEFFKKEDISHKAMEMTPTTFVLIH